MNEQRLPMMRIPRYVPALLFALVMGVMVTAMVVTALDFSRSARRVPLIVGIPTAVAIWLQLIRDGIRVKRGDVTVGGRSEQELDPSESAPASDSGTAEARASTPRAAGKEDRSTSTLGAMLWVLLVAGLIWLFGMLVAIPVFMALFMRIFGGERFTTIVVFAVLTTVAVHLFFVVVLEIRLYTGLLGDLLSWI